MTALNGRVAIVTGAARGIGAATAERLAADGFAVAVLDLNEDDARGTVEAIEAAGGRALAVGADVGDAEQVQAAVDRIAAELGPPVVLVNNAGVTKDNLLFKMSDADWDVVMHVHLRGSFLMARAVQKHMTEAKWGRIVNLSSTSALGNRGQANYATAKAGLQGFTKTLAIELGKFGVTANAIAPGLHRHRHDEGDGGADRPGVGALRGGAGCSDPGGAGRLSRGHRAHRVVPGQRGCGVRLRAGHLRRRRAPQLGLRTTGRGPGSAPGPGRTPRTRRTRPPRR